MRRRGERERWGVLVAPQAELPPGFVLPSSAPIVENPAVVVEPPPISDPGRPDIQSLVVADVLARREFGIKKYGTALQANNGRNALWDAYQEALDLVAYLRQMIEESDGTGG